MVFAKSMRILEAWSAMSSWQMWQSSGRAPSGGGDIVFRYAGEEFKVVLPRRQRNRRSVRSSAGCEFWNLNSARRYETGFSWGYCFLPGRIRCGLCSAGGGWQTVPEKTQADTDFLTCKREKGNNRADSCNRGLAVSQIPGLALPAPISSVQDHFSKFLQWRPSFSIRSSASFGPHVPAA